MNIIFWITYYLKCGLNMLFSYILNLFRKVSNKKINNKLTKVNDYFYVIKLEGNYYQMGYQYGTKLKNLIIKDINKFKSFINSNHNYFYNNLNNKIKSKIKNTNLLEASYLMFLECKKDIPEFVIEYIKGMSYGTNIEFKELMSINFFLELMENHCILYSSKNKSNNILCLRTLDFGCPLITQVLVIFKPGNKNSYASLTPSFMFGSATMFSKNIILGESYYDFNLGSDSRIGIPFYFLFHKLLADYDKLDKITECLKRSKRIGNLEIMVSDIVENNSVIFKYCQQFLKVNFKTNMKNQTIYSVSPNEKVRFEKYKDTFKNAKEAINKMLPMVKSGELHSLIYDEGNIYISVTEEYLQSYNNDFIKFKLNDIFI